METLDHEKFQGVQELAAISTKIAAGTAALGTLKAGEETYLAEREQRLVARLKSALVDSSELISAIGENHGALVGYRNDLTGFHDRILSLIQGVDSCMSLISEDSAELDARVTAHEQAVAAFKEASIRERVRTEGERGELSQWRDQLGALERKLNESAALAQQTINRTKK